MSMPKATYKPTDGEINQSSYRVTLTESDVRALRLAIPGIGVVCLGNMSRMASYRVYEVLMKACKKRHALRDELESDEELTCEKFEDWVYILNTLIDAGVKLPIVQESEVGRD